MDGREGIKGCEIFKRRGLGRDHIIQDSRGKRQVWKSTVCSSFSSRGGQDEKKWENGHTEFSAPFSASTS